MSTAIQNSPGASEVSPLLRPTHTSTQEEETGNEDWRQNLRVKLALPAVILSFFFGYYASVIQVNPFIYSKISSEYGEIHTSSQHPCTKNMTSDGGDSRDEKIQQEIQKRVSTIELHLGLVSCLPAVIPVFFLGPLSDTYGRKIGFICPILGTVVRQLVYICVANFNLPLEVLFIGNIAEALGGGFAAVLMTMFSVISDVTQPGRHRSLGIAIMEGLQTLSAAIVQVCVAQWFKTSLIYPLDFAMAMQVFALVFTLYALPETLKQTDRSRLVDFAGHHGGSGIVGRFILNAWTMAKRSIKLYTHDPEGRLAKRRLCLTVFLFTIAVDMSKGGIQTLFLMKFPLCWPNTKVITFSGIQLACNWLLIWTLLPVLQGVLNMKERHIAIIGCVSSFVALVFMSLAKNDTMVYEVTVVGVFVRVIIPMIRSIMSSVVDATDQGAVYAGFGCIETLGSGLFGIIANRVYYATISTFAGAVFLLLAGVMLVDTMLVIYLSVIFNRQHKRLFQKGGA